MNLEQFKQQFDSEYRKRCDKQEEIIKELHLKISDQKTIIAQLQNRCYVFTGGALCLKCGFIDTCQMKQKHG